MEVNDLLTLHLGSQRCGESWAVRRRLKELRNRPRRCARAVFVCWPITTLVAQLTTMPRSVTSPYAPIKRLERNRYQCRCSHSVTSS